jgi:voltage-gated potassium channel
VLVLECMWLAVWDSLSTLTSLMTLMFIGLLTGSTLIYFAESSGWNGRPSPLNSVPMAAWSVVQMISTVGLGDVAPITPIGRMIGGILMMAAMCLVAFPSIILALNFQRHYDLQRQRPLDETDLL